jgi:hypothetical protein
MFPYPMKQLFKRDSAIRKNNHVPRMPHGYPLRTPHTFFGFTLGISNFCAGLSCRISSSHSIEMFMVERIEIHAVGMQISH